MAFDKALEAVVVFDFGIAAGDDWIEFAGGGEFFNELGAKFLGIGFGEMSVLP